MQEKGRDPRSSPQRKSQEKNTGKAALADQEEKTRQNPALWAPRLKLPASNLEKIKCYFSHPACGSRGRAHPQPALGQGPARQRPGFSTWLGLAFRLQDSFPWGG